MKWPVLMQLWLFFMGTLCALFGGGEVAFLILGASGGVFLGAALKREEVSRG